MMFKIEIDNILELQSKFQEFLSIDNLIIRTIKIAEEAGQILLTSAVQNCIDSVYGASNPFTDFQHEYERTLALLDSHIIDNNGLEQFIGIDPSYEVVDSHSGRELVMDYAIPVHEGYVQFVFGKNTGIFHEGRFWFDNTVHEQSSIILQFVQKAFEEIIMEVLGEVFK